MRLRHYSIHTERNCIIWIKRFIKFHNMRDRAELAIGPESRVESFLSSLALEGKVAVSTQNQAMNALVFLYKQVLELPFEKRINAVRSTKNRRIPVVLTQEEVKQIITLMEGTAQLIVKLLYGSGLRITEAARLRIQDLDFDYKQITVRSGKGNKDRVTTFSETLIPPLQNHLNRVKLLHEQDLAEGYGSVYLPNALERKYPNADRDWIWQYVFPARTLSTDPRGGIKRRHHIDQSVINKAIKTAVRKLGLTKKISAHTFRHNDVETTMIYTHALQQGGQGVLSPLDDLGL